MGKKDKDTKIYCDIRRCLGCRSCEIACAVEHSKSKELVKAIGEAPAPKKRVWALSSYGKTISLHCQHCEDAPCVHACMSGALTKDKKTGATVHNRDKCIGCWMCVMVCPFGAIVRQADERVAVKCDLCPDREDFACIAACPTKALFISNPDEMSKRAKSEVRQ